MTNQQAHQLLTMEQLWQFSLEYYSSREVKDACLALQNQFHGNVNLLIALKWLDEHHYTIQEQDWHRVEQSLGRTEALLHHYRELRRKLKTALSDTLYREALQFELQLEKQQQADLVDCINHLTLTSREEHSLTQMYCLQLGAEHLQAAFAKPVEALLN
ncbi:TIGR02444 family protein [Vibrio agarivorans]|uniref:TIGR02444 family protein n=1 Tax=Vibrio agarivorans TaxID=153622 RepID=UPI0025B57AB2|nr:TIGR02444 family protein [Vibrio agarivorans]MDN3661776.1 TIGR02444 family protein [Vibrio agarivorans]